MLPALAMNDAADVPKGYAKCVAQLGQREVAGSVLPADFSHLLAGKFGVMPDLAPRDAFRVLAKAVVLACRHTFFASGIAAVFGVGSEPQMRRVHAGAIVATVADGKARRDWAVCQFIGIPMCADGPVVDRDNAVPVVCSSGPNPACAGLVNRSPEAGNGVGHMRASEGAMAGSAAKLSSPFAKVSGPDVKGLATSYANGVGGGRLGVHWSLLGFRAMPLGVSAPQGFLRYPIIQRMHA